MKKTAIALAIAAAAPAVLAAAPSNEEMWQVIQDQQAEIERLKSELKDTDAKVNSTADAIEQGGLAGAFSRTTLGGYGEHHFNHFTGNNSKDEVDAHRFVLFINHQFSDTVRLYSELELEHSLAGEGEPGEVELEQAYIQWDYAQNHNVSMGLFLIPVGILNETHEPDTFYGVERNPVESQIVPSTWWETGAMLGGELAPGLQYNLAATSGLKMSDGGTIRGGRQKSAEAEAESLAYTARLKYTGIRGLEAAATVQYQEDVTQSNGIGNNEAMLYEAHVRYTVGGLTLTALGAMWDIEGDTFEATGRDEQQGAYVEASYKVTPKLGVFVRQNQWDNNAGNSADTEIEQTDVGLNFWLVDRVVLKADVGIQDTPNDTFNLGIGWSF